MKAAARRGEGTDSRACMRALGSRWPQWRGKLSKDRSLALAHPQSVCVAAVGPQPGADDGDGLLEELLHEMDAPSAANPPARCATSSNFRGDAAVATPGLAR